MALAYERWLQLDAAETCRCGTKRSDWHADDGRLWESTGRPPVWAARVAECEGCKQIAALEEEEQTLDRSVRAGRHVVLERVWYPPDASPRPVTS